MSMRPTPFAAAIAFSFSISAIGPSFLPFTETGVPASKPISTVVGLVRRLRRRDDPLPHGFIRRVCGIFENAAFVAQVPDVAVAAVDILLGLIHGNIVRLRVSDRFFARIDFPFAPRRDDGQFRRERFGGKLEPHLVVTFARAAVSNSIGAELLRELHLPFREQRTPERCAEQIFMFVNGAGAERRPDVAGNKFLAQVFDIGGACAGGESFFVRGLKILFLAQIADHGDHFAAVISSPSATE